MTTVRVLEGLGKGDSSVRLRAALQVGTTPDPRFVDVLVERCAIEPDFSVREMLTWALTRHPSSTTVPKLVGQLRSVRAQARSQARQALRATSSSASECWRRSSGAAGARRS